MRLLIVLGLALALSGCCTDEINVTSCPPLSTVSPDMRARLSAELKAIRPDSATAWMSTDWLRMRDAIRACQESAKK